MEGPPAGPIGRTGPSPETLGLASLLAAIVGGGFILFMFRRRRRRPPTPAPDAARAAAPTPKQELWTNVRLDDNDALPPWLRAVSEPERAPVAAAGATYLADAEWDPLPSAPLDWNTASDWEPGTAGRAAAVEATSALAEDEAAAAEHVALPLARKPVTFADPLSDGAMRLAIGSERAELLAQPGDGAVLVDTLLAGDEVEIQDIEEPWIRVVTALGSTGWIRSESLGFGTKPAAAPAAVEPAAVGEPADLAMSDAPPAKPKPKRRATRAPRRSSSHGTAA